MKDLRKLTLLHSNDLHGDFMAKEIDNELLGGVSMLSGYVNKVRHEEENVIYAISGDMFRGSVIDSEYKGISTINIMNMLSPDVVTLGNHEFDYGIGHLLFVEKCANFPIINANMYLTSNQTRIFRPHLIKKIGGMKILFIGVLTEDVIAQTRKESITGDLVTVHDPIQEIGIICNAYRSADIDLTVLLTHIGFEEDKKLASMLDPRWGVDIIIGGHSHTYLEEPEVVAGIPIVQAAFGTAQIGRFDLILDTSNNCISTFSWKLVPIDETECPRDTALEELILRYKKDTDQKYGKIITRLADRFTHPARNRETNLGKLLADALCDSLDLDIMLLASGSIREQSLGPIVQYHDLMEILPFNDDIYCIYIKGEQLRHMIKYMLRDEAFTDHTEFYQFSRGFRAEYDKSAHKMLSLTLNGREVDGDDIYKVGMHGYHFQNIKEFLDVSVEDLSAYRKPRVISTNDTDILEEYFSHHDMINIPEDQRIVIHNA